jgi:Crinkler effector protein N-terminal domain
MSKGRHHKVSPTDSLPQPQATMSSVVSGIADLTLWCLVEGKSNIFKVKIPVNADIADLKKQIKKEREETVFRDVDPYDLVLWKVRYLQQESKRCHRLTSQHLNRST